MNFLSGTKGQQQDTENKDSKESGSGGLMGTFNNQLGGGKAGEQKEGIS
jgi:hypothetical protein